MYNWKVEEMALMNENGKFYVDKTRNYPEEEETSREDKIAFVDSFQDGKLSYLLALQEKYDKEKEQLPKDKYGNVRTVSLKAWIKRNDTKYQFPLINDDYDIGRYTLCCTTRNIKTGSICRDRHDTYIDFVNECFHQQLVSCEKMEWQYFREHDEYSQLCAKIIKYDSLFDVKSFGVCLATSGSYECSVYDENDIYKERKLTIEEARELVSKFEELEKTIEKLTSETNIKY